MPEARDIKKGTFHKVFNLFHEFKSTNSHSSQEKPPALPPKPNVFLQGPQDADNFVDSFNALSISNPPSNQSNTNFIGGFNLVGTSTHTPTDASPSFAMPVPQVPSIPGKQSLTMQMAMQPDMNDFVDIPIPPGNFTSSKPSRPHSPNAISPVKPKPNFSSELSPPAPSTPTRPSSTGTPTKNKIKISNTPSTSQVSTPSGKGGPQVQCSGVTKAGKRCQRQVKLDMAGDDDEDEEETVPRFCYQHATEIMNPSGYYARLNGIWVIFDDWIPPYLQASSQASLRAEMEKSVSARDVPGYIYTFEIRDLDSPETIKLKVGRAVNLVKRMDQWGKQCGSKEQVLRGFYPDVLQDRSLLKGRVQVNSEEKARNCHRLERLIHIELADIISTSVHLEPNWPHVEAPATAKQSKGNMQTTPCADCGSFHKEIFEFQRFPEGIREGKEWEMVVKPVLERWGRFVDLYV